MSNLFGITFITLLIIILLAGDGSGQSSIKVSINTNYIGDNDTIKGFSDLVINITINKLGHMVYLEEYYTLDSNEKPKFVVSNRYYDDNITNSHLSIQILRPFGRGGRFYNLVKGVILLDNKRIYEKWIKTTSGAILSNDEEKVIDNNIDIDKYEIDYKLLAINLSTTYIFTIPILAIYEADVISMENEDDVPLRIILYKDMPIYEKRFPGPAFKYLDITLGTNKIKKIKVRYKIGESWINDSDVPEESIKLFRWNFEDNKWYGLKTNIINKDSDYIYYESEIDVSNISNKFAIAGLRSTIRVIINQTELIENKNLVHNTIPEISENKVSIIDLVKKSISNLKLIILKMK